MIVWECVAGELAWDGSLRDVCIPGTTLSDWARFLSDMTTWPWPIEFTRDGAACSLPQSADAAFAMSRDAKVLLSVRVAGMSINCHFFAVDEIELDVDPRELRGQAELKALLAFMRRIGQVTNKPVLLTHEGWRESSLLRVLPPDGRVQAC